MEVGKREEEEVSEKMLKQLGLQDKTLIDALKSEMLTTVLVRIMLLVPEQDRSSLSAGSLLYSLGVKSLTWKSEHQQMIGEFVVPFIVSGRIHSQTQLSCAFQLFDSFDVDRSSWKTVKSSFSDHCGIGVEVTLSQIEYVVSDYLIKHRSELDQEVKKMLKSKGYQGLSGLIMAKIKHEPQLKFADFKQVKEQILKELPQYWSISDFETELYAKEDLQTKKHITYQHKQQKQQQHQHQQETEEQGEQQFDLELLEKQSQSIKLRDRMKWIGQIVKVSGWITKIREGSTDLIFIEIRDGTASIQAILTPKQQLKREDLKKDCSISIVGKLALPPPGKYCKGKVEIQAISARIIGTTPGLEGGIEQIVTSQSSKKLQFDLRHLMLRTDKVSLCLKLRSVVISSMRRYLDKQQITEVHPPTLGGTLCEGGSEVFTVDWFGKRKAYLTQSQQLYLEACVPGLGDVYTMMSSFRAETCKTSRHLAEFLHLEVELAWIKYEDLLQAIEDLVLGVLEELETREEYKIYWKKWKKLQKKEGKQVVERSMIKRGFKRMTYKQAIEYCREHKIYKDEKEQIEFEYGDDIKEKEERQMVDKIGEPVLLCRFPAEMKAFYMERCPDDEKETESVDLLVPKVGEIVGGSMRIWEYAKLLSAYEREGLKPEDYKFYTDVRLIGAFPHGGYGLGVERFLKWVLGESHIKDVCLFPRTVTRLAP